MGNIGRGARVCLNIIGGDEALLAGVEQVEGQAGGSLHSLLSGDTLQSDFMEYLSVQHFY